MLDYNLFKPIRNFGSFILAIGASGVCFIVMSYNNPDFIFEFKIYLMIISAFNLFMGYNIISRNKFGYKCLRFYLYLLYLGFPLGYCFAKKTLEYIETNKIEKFFNKSLKI